VLVQRNVGNIASFKDMNLMSCLEYAVAGAHRVFSRLQARSLAACRSV
jgi:carbonic anhydrase